jgi:hypothetical protein
MKIKKKQIEEAVLGAGVQQSQTPTMSPEDTRQAIEGAKELEKAYDKLGASIPFMSKVSENSGDYIDYLSTTREKLMNDYNEWLSTPEGIAYMDELLNTPEGIAYMEKTHSNSQPTQPEDNPTDDLPFESFKDKRKVIKTIKLKDLK